MNTINTPVTNETRLLAFLYVIETTAARCRQELAGPLMPAESVSELYPEGIEAETPDSRAAAVMDECLASIFASMADQLGVPQWMLDNVADYVVAAMNGCPPPPYKAPVHRVPVVGTIGDGGKVKFFDKHPWVSQLGKIDGQGVRPSHQ